MAPIAPPVSARAFRTVWVVGVLGIALSLALAGWFWREARKLDQIRFDELTHRLTEDLDTQTEKIEAMLRELARVLSAQAEPSLAVWEEFMNQASPSWNFPGVMAIGYATNHDTARVLDVMQPWLRDTQPKSRLDFYRMPEPLTNSRQWSARMVDVFRENVEPVARFNRQEQTVSTDGKEFRGRRFKELQDKATFKARCPFFMGTPYGRGLELAHDDIGSTHLQDTVARDDVHVQQDLFPLQGTNGARLTVATMLVAVAHPRRHECWERLSPATDHADEQIWLRWQLNAGLIFAGLDYAAILKQIQGKVRPEVEVEIYTKENPSVESWLNPRPGATMRAGSVDHQSAFARLHRWPMYGAYWKLYFYTTPLFDQHSTRLRAWWAGGLGFAVTTLFCWALAVQTRGRLLEARRASELKEARDALQGAQKERERLSHDLHDGAIQSLYAIQLGLTRAGRAVEARAPDTAHTLQESRISLDAVIGELRGFITEMKRDEPHRPTAGLAAVLDSLVRRLRSASTAPIELECDAGASERLTSAQALQLVAIAREALSNSLRHAHAQNIAVRLTGSGTMVTLEISDDGAGFDVSRPGAPNSDSAQGDATSRHAGSETGARGMGLNTMKRRASDLGASLEVQSAPGKGTRIRVEVPLNVKEPSDE